MNISSTPACDSRAGDARVDGDGMRGADALFHDALFADALCDEIVGDADRFIDEIDWLVSGEQPDEPLWGADIFTSGAAHASNVDAFEQATAVVRAATARQCTLIAQTLADAEACPDAWCGPDPTVDPDWRSPRGQSVRAAQGERREMAVRAAVCDLATRAHVSEQQIRSRAHMVDVLRSRCPRMWALFSGGAVDERTATVAAEFAQSLPADDVASWQEFDGRASDVAARLTPGTFRVQARVIRERVHPESTDDRHRRAVEDRCTWMSPEVDGMATWAVFGPAATLHAIDSRIDQTARRLRGHGGDTRTLAQLRADVVCDLLAHGSATTWTGAGGGRAEQGRAEQGRAEQGRAEQGARVQGADVPIPTLGKPAVAITIPAMTLLGRSDEPATLDGYGPIDIDTAVELAGGASSWVRILTHPVTGAVLNLDRTTYRVTADMRRWLDAHFPVCTFPGCGRLAVDCQIDHRDEWRDGGATDAANLAPLCHHHHRVKTETRWRPSTGDQPGAPAATPAPGGASTAAGDGRQGTTAWTSPTGRVTPVDPPPW